MNPSTMTRQELEDTVVILQHICNEASRTINKASEYRWYLTIGNPCRSTQRRKAQHVKGESK